MMSKKMEAEFKALILKALETETTEGVDQLESEICYIAEEVAFNYVRDLDDEAYAERKAAPFKERTA